MVVETGWTLQQRSPCSMRVQVLLSASCRLLTVVCWLLSSVMTLLTRLGLLVLNVKNCPRLLTDTLVILWTAHCLTSDTAAVRTICWMYPYLS